MRKLSAGILLYRWSEVGVDQHERLEIFLVHPGGPFWMNKDAGAWSIPKGEYTPGEEAESAARREFEEETGFAVPPGALTSLGEVKQPGGKVVTAWALEGDCAAERIKSNLFSMEWPPRSGKTQEFPEVDRAGWFALDAAREKLLAGQRELLDRLVALVRPGAEA